MKKIFLAFVLLAGASLLTGCLKDNYDGTGSTYQVTLGAFVLNAGSPEDNIDGSLSYIKFGDNSITSNVLENIGSSPSDVFVRGGKVYVASAGEDAVFVLDKTTFRLLGTISTTTEMGQAEGQSPRRLAACNDKMYVSTAGGYVGVIDTLALSIEKKYQVGPYPEGMSVGIKDEIPFLYVANSDNGNGNGSVSIINLSSGATNEFKNEKISRPLDLAAAGDQFYVLDKGHYDDNGVQREAGIYYVNGSNVTSLIPDATGMSGVGYDLLTYNAPEDPDKTLSYSLYNLNSGVVNPFYFSRDSSYPILFPSAISIDSNTGYVMLATQKQDAETGKADKRAPGYVNLYYGSGQFYKSYPVGVNPLRIAFVHGTFKIQ